MGTAIVWIFPVVALQDTTLLVPQNPLHIGNKLHAVRTNLQLDLLVLVQKQPVDGVDPVRNPRIDLRHHQPNRARIGPHFLQDDQIVRLAGLRRSTGAGRVAIDVNAPFVLGELPLEVVAHVRDVALLNDQLGKDPIAAVEELADQADHGFDVEVPNPYERPSGRYAWRISHVQLMVEGRIGSAAADPRQPFTVEPDPPCGGAKRINRLKTLDILLRDTGVVVDRRTEQRNVVELALLDRPNDFLKDPAVADPGLSLRRQDRGGTEERERTRADPDYRLFVDLERVLFVRVEPVPFRALIFRPAAFRAFEPDDRPVFEYEDLVVDAPAFDFVVRDEWGMNLSWWYEAVVEVLRL